MNKFKYYLLALCFISSLANAHTGATFCQSSPDGKKVTCGGRATSCQSSPDGKNIACGGAKNSAQDEQ